MRTRARAPLDRDEVIHLLRDALPELRQRYGVRTLWLFGSYAHGAQRRTSDVDLLVEFERTPGLFRFIELQQLLGHRLGVKVDLATRSSLKPSIKERVLGEALRI